MSVDAVGDQLERAGSTLGDVVLLDALAQDRQARGEVGRADVGDEAGLEALAQAVLERVEVAREAVGGEHELAPASWSALKVWKNSSSVLALPARNWTSSMSRTSTPR